jgi:hypothetical protein
VYVAEERSLTASYINFWPKNERFRPSAGNAILQEIDVSNEIGTPISFAGCRKCFFDTLKGAVRLLF